MTYPDCGMTRRCGCAWTVWRDPAGRLSRIQHGIDPEQSRSFTDVLLRWDDVCRGNHSLEVERWMAEVVEYEHPNGYIRREEAPSLVVPNVWDSRSRSDDEIRRIREMSA